MPEVFLDDLNVGSGRQEEAGRGVPEGVQGDVAEAGSLREDLEGRGPGLPPGAVPAGSPSTTSGSAPGSPEFLGPPHHPQAVAAVRRSRPSTPEPGFGERASFIRVR